MIESAGGGLDFAALFYLAVFGGLLPAAAFASGRRLAGMELPPRPGYFRSVILQQAIFGIIAVAVARRLGIPLLPSTAPSVTDWLLGAGFLAAAVAWSAPEWHRLVDQRDRRVWLVSPRTAEERWLWAVLSLFAGVVEEIAYRGVMFGIVFRLTGSWPASAGLCGLAFGLAHLAQGRRAVVFVTAIGVAFHGLVWATGSLVVAMAAHLAFDLIAGFRYGQLADRAGLPERPPPLTDLPARTPP